MDNEVFVIQFSLESLVHKVLYSQVPYDSAAVDGRHDFFAKKGKEKY